MGLDPERNDIRKVDQADDYLDIENHFLAERKQRKAGHLEVAGAERYADDGDAEQNSEENVNQPSPEPAENQPDDIQRNADATYGIL